MSFASLERAVLHGARDTFKNPKLKMKDILEWSSGDIEPQDGEIVSRVNDPGVNVAIKKENDKR